MEEHFLNIKLKTLPNSPGVYQYFDKSGKIIYVGKAKDLKKRVSSYFSKIHEDGKTRILVKKIHDIQYIVVASELDALLLENNLIKKHKPKYNILLKDDKSYPWICIKNEAFPRVFSTRRLIKDGSKYYGPYPNGKVMHTLLNLIRDLFPLRTCNLDLKPEKISENKFKVCLEYHIGNCEGPCIDNTLQNQYAAYIKQIDAILKGNFKMVTDYLRNNMLNFANNQAFEQAQKEKEKLDLLEQYQAKSTIVSPSINEIDVITCVSDEANAFVNYLIIKNGAIVFGITKEINKKLAETNEDILLYTLINLRNEYKSKSKEVLVEEALSFELPELKFTVPQIGDKKQLVELSRKNAFYYRLEKYKNERITNPEKHTNRILQTLQKDLKLSELPVHIECFDNSNIQGTNPVAACVVFKDAKPSKKDYRHFNIKTVEGPNDFASMEEVLIRRYSRLLNENSPLPNLIIIDGGKGQLSSAMKSIKALGLKNKIAVIGIAKRLEEIFFPGDNIPIYIDKRSESLKLIQHLRNEAHRFGITHHRNRRSKNAYVSELSQIEGIGEKTYELLMKKFKTMNKIKSASLENLAEVIGPAKAKLIVEYFMQTD